MPTPPGSPTPAPPVFRAGHRYVLRVGRAGPCLEVEVAVDPADPATHDDSFTLRSADGAYEMKKTVADDVKPGDQVVTLRFTGVEPAAKYSLEVDPGAGGEPYFLFVDRPLGQAPDAPAAPEPEAAGAAPPSAPEVAEEPAPLVEVAPPGPRPPVDFEVEIPILPETRDDTFTLRPADGSAAPIVGTLEPQGEGETGVLRFKRLASGQSYSLEVDPGDGEEPYLLFCDRIIEAEE